MTYNDLITYAPLATYAQNRDTLTEMPQIVRRAQDYIVARLDHDAFKTVLPATSVSPDGRVDKRSFPDALLEIRAVMVEVRKDTFLPMTRRPYEMLLTLYQDQRRGMPRHYTEDPDGGLHVFPRPGRQLQAIVTGNVEPPVLSASTPENTISREFPEVFELAATMEAAAFNLDAAALQLYQARLGEALTAANSQIGRRKRDEASQRPLDTSNITGA